MTPHDQFRLEKQLLDLAKDGVVPTIVGVHSHTVEDGLVYVIYDISPDPTGGGLHFTFEFPELISREELCRFSEWLAKSGLNTTIH